MAFFCPQSGARVVCPGVSKSVGGNVPDYDGSDAHVAAESAAILALQQARRSPEEVAASPDGIAAAVKAGLAALVPKIETKAEPPPKPAMPTPNQKKPI